MCICAAFPVRCMGGLQLKMGRGLCIDFCEGKGRGLCIDFRRWGGGGGFVLTSLEGVQFSSGEEVSIKCSGGQ